MERALFTANRLFCPGPTPSPWFVKSASLESDIYHRSPEFEAMVVDCRRLLKPLFGCKTDPVLLTSSGTGAMESMVLHLTSPGDQVVVVVGGKFGERWKKINEAYQNHVTTIEVKPGDAPTKEAAEEGLKRVKNLKAFFMQAHETSTGACFDVKTISSVVRRHAPDCMIVVDAISSLGAHPLEMESWGIDGAISGSQKGFGVAPGLSFVALSERAWDVKSQRGKFYFDLLKERKGQETGRTAWTPAISLIQGLHASLQEMHRSGFHKVLAHHELMGKSCRAAMSAMNLELFVSKEAHSNTLTAVKVPSGMDGVQLLQQAKKKYGAIISGGQDELKGKIIRFSHLGLMSPFMLFDGIAALEFSLADLKHSFELGSGVKAAMQAWHHPKL